jgi:RNA polymerase sigma-70 factor (ECF subfamily)
MQPDDQSARLTSISTQWSKLFQAHQGQGEAATQVQRELLLRYYGAVYRYLLGTVRDAAGAEDLTQEFAVRFLRGDFRRADPGRGRFRDFLKTALRHLAIDYWRKKDNALAPLGEAGHGLPAPPSGDDLDRDFLDRWREELLRRTWHALAKAEEKTGQPYYTLLRYKTEHPEARAVQLGDYLRTHKAKVLSVEGVRQFLHRAREQFAELLLDEVAQSVPTTDTETVEQELLELNLLEWCRSALQRRGR